MYVHNRFFEIGFLNARFVSFRTEACIPISWQILLIILFINLERWSKSGFYIKSCLGTTCSDVPHWLKKNIFKLFFLLAAAIITSAQNIFLGLMADLNYSLLDCHLPLVSLQVMPCTLIASLYVLWGEVFQYRCVIKAQAW